MIKPVNGHLLIEPLQHEGFMATQKETYEEIGVVIEVAGDVSVPGSEGYAVQIQKGTKVYFDSWLAAKYPKNDEEFYWLVKWEDVRAIETTEDTVGLI